MEYLFTFLIILALLVWDKFFYRERTGRRHQAPDLIGDADRAHRE